MKSTFPQGKKHRALLFVEQESLAQRLVEFCQKKFHTVSIDYYTGLLNLSMKSSKRRDFENRQLNIMVVVKLFGEGYDNAQISTIGFCNTDQRSSVNQFYQFVGRSLRRVDSNDTCMSDVVVPSYAFASMWQKVLNDDFVLDDK